MFQLKLFNVTRIRYALKIEKNYDELIVSIID
jgi:hypothetical protein